MLADNAMNDFLEGETTASSGSDEPAPAPKAGAAEGGAAAPALKRASTLERVNDALTRAGSHLERAGSNLQLTRASTLPKEDAELVHAATMPTLFDQADRPWWGGMWKTQQLMGFLLGLIALIVFCAVRPITEFPQANDMLGITVLCACFWVFEVIPIYITALIPLVALPLFRITSSDIVAKAYWNWISLLVVSTYLISIALETTQLPKRVALCVLLRLGVVSPGLLLACFMGLTCLLAMVASNIAVALWITPFAISLMLAAEEQVRNQSEADAEQGEDQADAEARFQAAERAVKDVQKFSDGLLLGIAYSAAAGGMATLTGSVAHYFLAGEMNFTSVVTWMQWFKFAAPIAAVVFVLIYVALYLRYVRGLGFKGIERAVLEAEREELNASIGPFSRDEAWAAGLLVLQLVLLIIRPFAITPFVTSPSGEALVNDATVACIPALLLFFVPSQLRPGQAIVTWPAVHARFDFGLLLLIGGGLAINTGFTQSGLDLAIGKFIAQCIPKVSSFTLELAIVACVTLSSQVISNVGTAATMLPVLGAAATQALVNPMALLLPATVASSITFMLPTASPPNVVVLAKSAELPRALRVRDFFSNGLFLTIITCLVCAAMSHVMGDLVFDASAPFPRWACEAAVAGNCAFVDVPGLVQGHLVESQACIINMGPASDGALCHLWNGTVIPVPVGHFGI